MPYSIMFLIFAAIALLALLDVGLGHLRPGCCGQDGGIARIGFREFATRPLPIFLFGIGVAMVPAQPLAGAGLLALAGLLVILKPRSRRGDE